MTYRCYQARCDNQTVAKLVGCHPAKVPLLVRTGLLAYLNPEGTGTVKYCATMDVLRRTADPKWQVRATQALAGTLTTDGTHRVSVSRKRQRGLSHPDEPSSTAAMTADFLVRQFQESLLVAPNGEPIPAMVPDAVAARLLGFPLHALPVLRRVGLLECLNPSQRNYRKLHSREYLLEQAVNVKWLADATIAMEKHWKAKNHHRSGKSVRRGHLQPTQGPGTHLGTTRVGPRDPLPTTFTAAS